MTTNDRDYYCSLKFSELSLDLEKRAVGSCCSAKPSRINFLDMRENGLLNVAYLKNDREDMLNNKRVESCYKSCWSLEDDNKLSKRLLNKVNLRTHNDTTLTKIQHLILYVGSRCNLTCAYCNKNYSRSWAQDILKNGNYNVDIAQDIYTYTKKDIAIQKLSQSSLYSGENYFDLLEQLNQINKEKVNQVSIVGGEPFLYDSLLDLIKSFDESVKIIILTGAGINKDKFQQKINLIKNFKNVTLAISAETLSCYYEFNRYGNTFKNFVDIVEIVKKSGLNYKFISTLSNLTIFGYLDFVKYCDVEIIQGFCSEPEFLRISVLDQDTKNQLAEQFDKENNAMFKEIISNLDLTESVTEVDRNNLSTFLYEFTTRRENLNLNIFPLSFLKWLNLNVV